MNTIQALKDSIESKKEVIATAQSAIDNFEIDESKYEEGYKGLIDECTEVIQIMGMSFTPSRVLEELDPIAFACGLSDYVDGIDKSDDVEYQELEAILEELESELIDLENELETLEEGEQDE